MREVTNTTGNFKKKKTHLIWKPVFLEASLNLYKNTYIKSLNEVTL